LNGATWRRREFPSVLNGKIDRDTIFIFSHTTSITYDKKLKFNGQKMKFANHMGNFVCNPK